MYCIHTPLHTYTVNIASFKRGITKEASRGASVVSSTCGGGGGGGDLETVNNTKGARAHTHRELIREWLWVVYNGMSHILHTHTHIFIYGVVQQRHHQGGESGGKRSLEHLWVSGEVIYTG